MAINWDSPHDTKNVDFANPTEKWTALWTALQEDHPALHRTICDLIRSWPALVHAQRQALLDAINHTTEDPTNAR